MRFYWLLFSLMISVCCHDKLRAQQGSGQDGIHHSYIDINKIALCNLIVDSSDCSFLEPGASLIQEYPGLTFKKSSFYRNELPDRLISHHAILRFNIYNSADTSVATWFMPGLYFWDVIMYKDMGGKLVSIPSILPAKPKEISYRYITLGAHDSATIVVELKFVRTHLNGIRPYLISPPYLSAYVMMFDNGNMDSKIITYLLCGLFMMMILFSLASFFQGSSYEYLYYSLYAFMLGLMLFIKAIFSFHTSEFGFFQEGYLDFIMQSAGTIFYMLFMQKFLNTRIRHPFLEKLYNFGIITLLFALLVFTYAHYFTDDFRFENNVENMTKGLLLCLVLIYLVYSIRHWDDRLLHYLFWGNLCLFIFALLSLMLVTGSLIPFKMPAIFRSALFYYELGLLFELIFFLMGLNYKNRRQIVTQARERERLKAANQMGEYEKEIAVYKAQQNERERISADMHDELGSGMTAIRLMSEIARNKMKENTPVEIEKISNSADEVLNKMNAIIWSMNSGNDTVDNLVSYIRAYALEYFEYTQVDCKIYMPEQIEERELTGDKRRNLFLCVKESLNNVLKHAKCTEVKIYFTIDKILTIKIIDNGVGIDMEQIRQFGNGLKNISKRMESIGGTYGIENKLGTVTTLRLPLS